MRVKLTIQSALAVLFGVMFVVTLIEADWIEAVFGVDPDGGSGALEWVIVAALLAGCLALAVAARTTWQRLGRSTGRV